MTPSGRERRSRFAPEIVQASALDCGPAALASVLAGFGRPVSFGRLREACQTDIDGTSIDALEQVAGQLGLDAEQVMLPADHVLLPEAEALPAIVVVRLPNGLTHFVVAWRRHGPWVQVMDPASGRRFTRASRFLSSLHLHGQVVPAAAWRAFAGSGQAHAALGRRLSDLGAGERGTALMAKATADPTWRSLAALDAAVRATAAVVDSGGLARGTEASRACERLFEQSCAGDETGGAPPSSWSVRPAEPGPDGAERLVLRGAVLLRFRGPRTPLAASSSHGAQVSADAPSAAPPVVAGPHDLRAAVAADARGPLRRLLELLRREQAIAPVALGVALLAAAGGTLLEALLLRGVVDLARELPTAAGRLIAVGALVAVSLVLLLVEAPLVRTLLGAGRGLEMRLRAAFLAKIPRLPDRYFQSRLVSDMADRCHSVHRLRALPDIVAHVARTGFEIAFVTAGIAWIDPASLPLALVAAVVAVALPFLAQPMLTERDLALRTHSGALGRFSLDALLGLVPARAHGAERSLRREHESLLAEWTRAGLALLRTAVTVDGLQLVLGFALAAALLLTHLVRGEGSGVLLLAWWALSLPVLGQELALATRQLPWQRSVALRLQEPLDAPEEEGPAVEASAARADSTAAPPAWRGENAAPPAWRGDNAPRAATLTFDKVTVVAGGHVIVREVSLEIPAGSEVAIVGPSGAGKSTLIGLALGFRQPASGRVLADGQPISGATLARLRADTAWVDPAVQLWNRTLLENLRYGAALGGADELGDVLEASDLRGLLERLPDGLQHRLGEGGGLLSGGEGQRVRLGRALGRPAARLVLLDEPFRGLERERRRALLRNARQRFAGATLLLVTHDVADALDLGRVIVIEGGRVVEDGVPRELAARAGSRFAALLAAEEAVRQSTWGGQAWRRLRLADGTLEEGTLEEPRATRGTP